MRVRALRPNTLVFSTKWIKNWVLKMGGGKKRTQRLATTCFFLVGKDQPAPTT